ncbi:MAG: hypothetical protein JTT16_04225 [Candidatus Brockarchaeota archaeon]|nr:hypothetical protein [Candidatus Brockarchaeota archaeon]MBO3768499.1 hypothetical protein [Candidatus Brockarchaeota archaeon]
MAEETKNLLKLFCAIEVKGIGLDLVKSPLIIKNLGFYLKKCKDSALQHKKFLIMRLVCLWLWSTK